MAVMSRSTNLIWIGILWFCFFVFCLVAVGFLGYSVYSHESYTLLIKGVIFFTLILFGIWGAIRKRKNELG